MVVPVVFRVYPGGGYHCPPCPEMDARQRYKLKKLYGMAYEHYRELYYLQNGGCAICGGLPTSSMYGRSPVLVVDHNEITGQVRGLLCRQCNASLHAVEDEQWRMAAMRYLEMTDACQQVG